MRHSRCNRAHRLSDGADGQPALVVASRDGALLMVERFDDGVRCDGPGGEPAQVWFHASGRVASIRHRRAGLLHDSGDGQAAVRWFDELGRVVSTASFVGGRRHG